MGSEHSHMGHDSSANLYNTALQNKCLLPDIGIEESLLTYSGTNSNAMLNAYSGLLVSKVPGFIDRLGSSLAPLTVVPNAVGFGAFFISMILEICMKSTLQRSPDSYSILQRVFGEEKGLAVRDTMAEILKQQQMYLHIDQMILFQMQRLRPQLSYQLTRLKLSLMYDGQMSSRGFKIWVNGASFHVQMLIHEARLNVKAGKPASDFAITVSNTINIYLIDLNDMLEKYKAFKTSKTEVKRVSHCGGFYHVVCVGEACHIKDDETKCYVSIPCENYILKERHIDNLFSRYAPITGLKTHFLNMRNNVYTLINQRGSFRLPSRT